MVVIVDEEILAKSGAELFKELLRVYSVAEVEDYYKAGIWKDDLMRTDIQLLYQHAREAGADDPTPLEEVKMPEMPRTFGSLIPTASRPAVPVAGAWAGAAGVKPVAAGAATGASASAAAEDRLISLFAAKWKLDVVRTKLMLAKLTPLRRRFVIQQFKATPGVDTTASLQAFISKQEQTSWPAPAGTVAGSIRPAASAVRPGATSIVGARTTLGVRPAGLAGAARPLGASGVRPFSPATRLGTTVTAGVKRALTPATAASGLPAAKRPQIMPKAASAGALGARTLLLGGGRGQALRPAGVGRPALQPGRVPGLIQRY